MCFSWKCCSVYLTVFLVLAGSRVGGQEVRQINSAEADKLFARGLKAYRGEMYGRARESFQQVLEFPLNQRSSAAQLMLSRTLFKLGRYEEALNAARQLQRRFADSRYLADARLISGDAYYSLGRFYEAATQYGRILATPASLDLQASAAERLAGIVENRQITPSAQERIELRVGAERMRDALFYGKARWYERLGWIPQSRLAMQAYIDSVDRGIFIKLARHSLQTQADRALNTPATLEMDHRLPAIEYSDRPQLPRLGLLIPLSGPDLDYGQDLLQGVQLANEQAGDPFEIVIGDIGYDYGDLPIEEREGSKLLRTVHAMRHLIEEEDVLAIIGPVFSSTSVAAAVVAEAAGVPLIVPLAQQSGLDSLGENVFQLSIAPEIQGRVLAEYATLVLGLQHLVILSPLSDYGLNFKKTFVDVARANGGEIVYEDWYVPYETKDFSFFFKEMRRVGFELMPSPEDTLTVEDSLLWEDGDSTLFLSNADTLDLLEEEIEEEEPPDSSEIFIDTIDGMAIVVETFEDAETITPQRHFHRLETQVLGNDLWYAPEAFSRLRRRDRSYFNGTTLVVGTHEQASSTREFVDAFRQRFRQDPLHAAHSYDAARLIIKGWEQGRQKRAQLRQWLGEVEGFEGASGTITFALVGHANSEFNLLRIEGQKMRPLKEEDLPELIRFEILEDDLDLPEMDLSDEFFENEMDIAENEESSE